MRLVIVSLLALARAADRDDAREKTRATSAASPHSAPHDAPDAMGQALTKNCCQPEGMDDEDDEVCVPRSRRPGARARALAPSRDLTFPFVLNTPTPSTDLARPPSPASTGSPRRSTTACDASPKRCERPRAAACARRTRTSTGSRRTARAGDADETGVMTGDHDGGRTRRLSRPRTARASAWRAFAPRAM